MSFLASSNGEPDDGTLIEAEAIWSEGAVSAEYQNRQATKGVAWQEKVFQRKVEQMKRELRECYDGTLW
jgi:hypothetical protein